ncbi:PASTA domain-containing protein [Williamsia deligens]|uniref:PASTA domain-containing protein n=1 Tax=Williamsia deligens TaxID=321325 RepID=A0ABW3G8N8_9NOCA|nr:PASTA domain-containing protein [Williamsia deligens]MCP2194155.1 PASTA domain-containing protein [Williamsia deligens]
MTTTPPTDPFSKPAGQAPQAKSSKKPWLIGGGIAVVAIAIIAAVASGGSGDDTTTAASAASTTTTTSTITVNAQPPATTAVESTTASPAPTSTSTQPPVAAGAAAGGVMPSVVCMNLQEAQDLIQQQGVFFSRSHDATGQGRRQVLDRNWVVVEQSPAPGTPISEGDADLGAVKIGEPSEC